MSLSEVETFILVHWNIALLIMLVLSVYFIMRQNNLFVIVMFGGLYSLICALWFVSMDAVDVAFTEAAVGAGASSMLLLGSIVLTTRYAKLNSSSSSPILPILIVLATSALLIYATFDLPVFGDPYSPANSYVGLTYLERAYSDTVIPNVVTVVLASYRGFDTLGEVAVIFVASVAVCLLLGFGNKSLSRILKMKRPDFKDEA